MRRLTALVLIAAALWSGWWFVGARATRGAIEGWLAAQRADGREAQADLRVRGFPSRFDTTFTDLAIGDPGAGWRWAAGEFQTLMLSYAPNRAIAVWPGPQRIETPLGAATVEGARASASVRAGVATDLPLEALTFVGADLVADGDGWRATVREARLALERAGGSADYHLGLQVADLAPPEAAAPLGDMLPRVIELIRVDAAATLSAPLAGRAAGAPPVLEAIEIAEARLDWGEMRVAVSGGPIEIGRDGAPYGRLDVRVEGWRRMVAAAVAAGIVPERRAPLTIAALDVIAGDGVARGVLETELVFEDGRMFLGPVSLGPAPRLPRQRQ